MTKLRTPRQIINALGGPSRTAELLNTQRSTPCTWYHRIIPPKYYLRIKHDLEPKGYELYPRAFGMLEVKGNENATQ